MPSRGSLRERFGIIRCVRSYDVEHRDPHAQARIAAIRSGAERSQATRALERDLTAPERLRAGFAMSRFAARLRAARP
jgi:hypothetical protein